MDLLELGPLIPNLSIDYQHDDIEELKEVFEQDFIDNPFTVLGLNVKVIIDPFGFGEFRGYSETFVHLITRKNRENRRVFDPFRANKIHWIKPILLNNEDDEINFFEYEESNGKMRDYFWFERGDFLVILQKINPEYLIITSFNIDNKKNRRHYERRYIDYISQK